MYSEDVSPNNREVRVVYNKTKYILRWIGLRFIHPISNARRHKTTSPSIELIISFKHTTEIGDADRIIYQGC